MSPAACRRMCKRKEDMRSATGGAVTAGLEAPIAHSTVAPAVSVSAIGARATPCDPPSPNVSSSVGAVVSEATLVDTSWLGRSLRPHSTQEDQLRAALLNLGCQHVRTRIRAACVVISPKPP